MKVLMHTCCAPCSVYCIQSLRQEGIQPTLYWYNPNIHPYMEYKARRDCLKQYAKDIGVNAIFEEEYGLDEFCKKVADNLTTRCQDYCYPVRLTQTAKYAKEHGYDSFTTTLLVSPYQNHEQIKQLGDKIATEYGLTFLYRDFREGFKQGQAEARQLGLYMQKYCGCIFSEEDANKNRITSDHKQALHSNQMEEKKIRLNWNVPNLVLRKHRNGNQDEIQFIYALKKEVYQTYIEKSCGEWNEENQKKLFSKYMKKYAKNIELIMMEEKIVGFYNGNQNDDNTFYIVDICIKPEYQNKGIGTAILKEILIEHNNQEIQLYVFKGNRAIKIYERFGFRQIGETQTHNRMIKKAGK